MNNAGDRPEIYVYGDIIPNKNCQIYGIDSGEATADEFIKALKDLSGKDIRIRINSLGGDVFAAQSMYTHLKMHNGDVEVIIDGVAASSASFIAMAANTIKMPKNALMMIHNPSAGIYGWYNQKDLSEVVNALDAVKESIMATYQLKSKQSTDAISEMMNNTTWIKAEQALEYGFIDEIMDYDSDAQEDESVQNSALIKVMNLPESFKISANARIKNRPVKTEPTNKLTEGNGEKMEIKTVQELKNQYPELCEQMAQETVKNAVDVERKRLSDIDQISNMVSPELLNKAKYVEPMNAGDLSFMALKETQAKGAQNRQDTLTDSNNASVANLTAAPDAPAQGEANGEPKNLVDMAKDMTNQLNSAMCGTKK